MDVTVREYGSTAEGYRLTVLPAPLHGDARAKLAHLLGHKGQPWLSDVQWRMARGQGDMFAVAWSEHEPVSNAWLGRSPAFPEVALLGHVFTTETHRRRGLATRLLKILFDEFGKSGGRWVLLGTANPAAARIYERFGFGVLNGEFAEGNMMMLRPADVEALRVEYLSTPEKWEVVRFERRHYPSACLLFNINPDPGKLPALGITRGVKAELKLLEALDAQHEGRCRCYVLVDTARGRVRGFACTKEGHPHFFEPHLPLSLREAFRAAVERTHG